MRKILSEGKRILLAAILGITLTVTASAATTYYVSTSGADAADGRTATNAAGHGPKATIQAALDLAVTGDTVMVLPGVYQGTGNRDLDFAGKALTLGSLQGPDKTIINCQGDPTAYHCGLSFTHNETKAAIVQGFTICNGYTKRGGGIFISGASPTIRNCIIRDNTAEQFGGGIYAETSGAAISPVLQSNRIMANVTMGPGGGIGLFGSGLRATIINNVIAGNRSGTKGGGLSVFTPDTASVLANNTISNNSAPTGGGICFEGARPIRLVNCIVWQNSATEGPQISLLSFGEMYPSEVTIEYTNVQTPGSIYADAGSLLHSGSGVTGLNPLFLSSGFWQGDFWVAGDYRLRPTSPLVNVGNNTAATSATDLAGAARIAGSKVDLGAYESGSTTTGGTPSGNNLTVTRLQVTPGATVGSDMFVLGATLAQRDFQPGVYGLKLKVGPYETTIPAQRLRQAAGQPLFLYAGATGLVSLSLNLQNGALSAIARGVNLRGVRSPISVSLESGTYTASGTAAENVINGTAALSLALLRGVEDGLTVSLARILPAANNLASLILQGGIVVRTPTDLRLAGTTVTFTWGEFTETLPGSEFAKLGSQFIYRKPAANPARKIALAVINLDACTFNLTVSNAPLQRTGTARCGLAFQNFNQAVDVPLP